MKPLHNFGLELLQAVSDWQRGGDAVQKKMRGDALKAAANSLPEAFKSAGCCFRRIALNKSSVWAVGTNLKLSETISAWTEDIEIAKNIKKGVPLDGSQGVIFTLNPTPDQVIVNLAALYRDDAFCSSMEQSKSIITGYTHGAGKYSNSQNEVVLEVEFLPLESIHSWGGYSSSELELAERLYGHAPSEEELNVFRDSMDAVGRTCGPNWLSGPEAVSRVTEKLRHHGERLSGVSRK